MPVIPATQEDREFETIQEKNRNTFLKNKGKKGGG
jgi:hypothetical protein